VCYFTLGDIPRPLIPRAIARSRKETRGVEGQARQLGNLGLCYRTLGDIPKAIDFLEQALALNKKLGSVEGQAIQLHGLGVIYKDQGQKEKARACLTEALKLYRQMACQRNMKI